MTNDALQQLGMALELLQGEHERNKEEATFNSPCNNTFTSRHTAVFSRSPQTQDRSMLYFAFRPSNRRSEFDNSKYQQESCSTQFNPLNPELTPICHLLALLGAHHFLHVSRIRVNSPEERGSQLLHDGSLKSHIPKTYLFCYHCSVFTLFFLVYVGYNYHRHGQ